MIIFKNILFTIIYYIDITFIKIFWRSIWGKALSFSIWDSYKKSILFEERTKYFGTYGAAELFSFNEFKYFQTKLLKDRYFKTAWLIFPYIIFDRTYDDNLAVRSHVKLG